jgi:hypothetical protein
LRYEPEEVRACFAASSCFPNVGIQWPAEGIKSRVAKSDKNQFMVEIGKFRALRTTEARAQGCQISEGRETASCLQIFLTAVAELTARENNTHIRMNRIKKEHQSLSFSLLSQTAASKQMYSFPFLLTEAFPLSICLHSPQCHSFLHPLCPFSQRLRRLGILA